MKSLRERKLIFIESLSFSLFFIRKKFDTANVRNDLPTEKHFFKNLHHPI